MLKEKVTFWVPALMLGVSVCTAAETAPATAKEVSPDYTVRLVNAGRQAVLRDVDEKISRANKLFVNGEYLEAVKIYSAIAEDLKPFSGEVFVKKREYCQQRIEDCYINEAEKAMIMADDSVSVGDFEKAIAICKEAILFCPRKKEELEKKIAFYEKRRNAAVIREQRDISVLQPAYAADNYKVDLLIEQGRGLVRREEYIKAKRCFEEVLLIDPYNDTAMQNLLGVNTLIQKAAKLRANATQKRYSAMSVWSGAVPVASSDNQESSDNNVDAPIAKASGNSTVVEKLQKVKIPKVEFQEQGFEEITDFLVREAKRHDETINFIFKPNPNPDKEVPVKELSKKNVSLYDLLNELQAHKVLTFRVDKNVVFVAAAGVPLEKNVVKMWHRDLPTSVDNEATLKNLITANNISMDERVGQWIKYNSKDHLIIANNTPDNLEKIEKALDELSNDEPDMVQIMFKFLEVKQSDLDELAFSWQYSRYGKDKYVFDNTGNSLLRHYSYGTIEGEEKPERWAGNPAAESVDDANLYFNWRDSKNQVNFQLYALDWADNKSILYAPRFTTIGGQMASIDISTKRHFTDEWEYIDEDVQGNRRFTGTFMPDLEQEESIGLQPFNITPQINGEHITLDIDLQIRQYMGTTEYIIESGEDPEKITKPIFNDRKIKTNVTVKDCSTVYIGGVVSDMTDTINDKVPILGDIPFIGRLFQAKYTKSEKTNLMVFVSCRIIKPDGTLRFPENAVQNGLPIFSSNM